MDEQLLLPVIACVGTSNPGSANIYICLPIYLGLSISLACYKILTKPRPGHCPVRGGGDWGGSLPALVGNNRVYRGSGC